MTISLGATLTTAAVSVALGGLMWAATIGVSNTPRRGAVLPRPAWPWTGSAKSSRRWLWAFPALGAAGIFLVLTVGWSPSHVPAVLLVIFGLPAAYTDARELRLPNQLTYGLAATSAITVVILAAGGIPGSAVRGLVCGAGYAAVLLAIALVSPVGAPVVGVAGTAPAPGAAALGLGDIKLAVGLGIVLGWTSLPALTAAMAVTALAHLLWVAGCSVGRKMGCSQGMRGTALGPWMVFGAAAALALALPAP
jgi:prepilin signal peptidase PulO-like enzyme (type II secretory pathway)